MRSPKLLEVSPDLQEFLLFIWDSQRCHVGDVTAVELLCCSGTRMTEPLRCNLKLIYRLASNQLPTIPTDYELYDLFLGLNPLSNSPAGWRIDVDENNRLVT